MKIKALTIYLGSGGRAPQLYKDATKDLAYYLAANKIKVVYGGMSAGTMGVLADSVLEKKGNILGIIPTSIKDKDFALQGLIAENKMITVDSMWERKKLLIDNADAALALPGGYGTLDEIFEFLYWGLKGYHRKPLGLVNTNNYWTPLLDFIQLACKKGKLEKEALKFLYVDEDYQRLLNRMSKFIPKNAPAPLSGQETHISYIEEGNLQDTQAPIIIEDTGVENLYKLANALVLKQLSKISRSIGVYDKKRLFGQFKLWVYTAATNRFITPYCPDMAVYAEDRRLLEEMLKNHIHVSVELREKWEGISDTVYMAKR